MGSTEAVAVGVTDGEEKSGKPVGVGEAETVGDAAEVGVGELLEVTGLFTTCSRKAPGIH